jgi:hypothetical protein
VVLALLLCGGVGVAGVLAYNSSKDDPGVAESSSPDPAKNASPTPSRTQDNSGPAGSASGKKVVFEVTGDGPVSLVYLRESGQPPVTVRDVELPWREEFTPERLLLISLTAIRGATTNGKLTCRVTVDGEEVVSKTSEGNFITAICTKSLLN